MARACRTVLATASETFQHCEAWDKKKKVDEVVGDVDFELERWVIRQDDLRQRLKVRVCFCMWKRRRGCRQGVSLFDNVVLLLTMWSYTGTD